MPSCIFETNFVDIKLLTFTLINYIYKFYITFLFILKSLC